MTKSLLLALSLAAVMNPQSGAKTLFYDPADAASSGASKPAAGLVSPRPILYARPFPSYGHVGVHYWFEDASGATFSEERAATGPGPFTLHVRNNVGAGFLTMWSTAGGGVELTPRYEDWNGHRMTDQVFVLPGVVPATGERPSRFVIVFGRSQTEMVGSAARAVERLRDLNARVGRDGLPQLVRESDASTPGEIGTYVVNRQGGPIAVELAFRVR